MTICLTGNLKYNKDRSLRYYKDMNNLFKNRVIIPLLLIIIGVAIFLYQTGFFSGPLVLVERAFLLDNKAVSILAPKNSEEARKDDPLTVAFRKTGDVLVVSVSSLGPTEFSDSIDCSKINETAVFTAYINRLNKEIEVCEGPINLAEKPEYQGYKMLMTSVLIYEGIHYEITVIVKENYLNTEEGKEKVKQIFESFIVR